MTPTSRTNMRILIGASSFADAQAALRIARNMLAGPTGQLGGLLIEDETLRSICHCPNQRVISASGTLIYLPSPTQIRTMMNADAQAFRRRLAEIAAPSTSRWTFEQGAGDLVESSLKSGQDWDILIFGYRALHPVPGKIVVFENTTTAHTEAVAMGEVLADQFKAQTVVYRIGADTPPQAEQGQIAARHFVTLQAALAQLARINAQAVVIDLARGPVRSSDQVKALLNASRCPIVILNSSSAEPALEHNVQIPQPPDG
ncbi:hypothetical protein [uncultured Roseovarius sp.]|uniref:hypothetical protein n=2 Tax=Roseovarius sp. TaxID=1486281 RepID=UPI0025DA9498|nr:hypothetical protein [uncultured Roseovarius sp.]